LRRTSLLFYLADELVSDTRDRSNQVGAAVSAQSLANLADALSQGVFCDVHVRPDSVEELFLLDDPSSVLDEIEQELKRFGREVEIVGAVKKAALRAVEMKVAEPEHSQRLEHVPPRTTGCSAIVQNFVRPASRLRRQCTFILGVLRSCRKQTCKGCDASIKEVRDVTRFASLAFRVCCGRLARRR
jgi:hypothetical protein